MESGRSFCAALAFSTLVVGPSGCANVGSPSAGSGTGSGGRSDDGSAGTTTWNEGGKGGSAGSSSGADNGGSGAAEGGGNSGSVAGSSGGDGGGGSGAEGGGSSGTDGGGTGSTGAACGAGDTTLPAEPTIPPPCATLQAPQTVGPGGVPAENLDTRAIQSALDACAAGHSVKLTASGTNNAFVTGPLTLPSGVTLWVNAGATLYGTRDPSVYGSASALITVSGANSAIVGDGVIDGQGGEPNIGSSQSWWDQNAGSAGNSPALIAVRGATNFTLYRITLHDSPKFHVKLGAAGFVVWGVTIKAPSKPMNSVGTALTYSNAHNTDAIDPGEAASNGYIVCSKISVGDDDIAIKGSSPTGVTHLVIAHNHFEAGHGMSIGSEFTGGVSDINVYDLSIDGAGTNTSGGSSNGIRIKSDSSRGGLVDNVTYSDVCVRNLSNPIFLTSHYSTATGSSIPQFTHIKIQNFHALGGVNTPKVTLDGYDSVHMNGIALDNVIVDGISQSNVTAAYTSATLGPGNVNFTPSGIGVSVTNGISGTSQPNACTGKWVTF